MLSFIFYSFSSYFFFFFFHNDSLFWPCEPYQTREKGCFSTANPISTPFWKWIIQEKRNKTMEECVPPVPVWFSFFFHSFLRPLLPCDDVTSSTLHTPYKLYSTLVLSLAQCIYSWTSLDPLFSPSPLENVLTFSPSVWFMSQRHLL
jgi:hypothetical protein